MTITTTAGLTASTSRQTTIVETFQPQPRAIARKQPSPTAWTAAPAMYSITSWAKAEGVGRKLKVKIKLALRINKIISNSNLNNTKSKLSPSTIQKGVSYAAVVKNKTVRAHPDTAATGHFFSEDCRGSEVQHEPLNVVCANNNEMQSSKTKILDIKHLPTAAKKAHVFTEMKKNLLSIPVLCDADCFCTFGKDNFTVIKDNKMIMKGPRCWLTNLWEVPIPVGNNNNQKNHSANSACIPTTNNSRFTSVSSCIIMRTNRSDAHQCHQK